MGDRPWYGDPELEEDDEDVNVTGDILNGVDGCVDDLAEAGARVLSCGDGYNRDSVAG